GRAAGPAGPAVRPTLSREPGRAPEPVEDGDRVVPGDRLWLEVQPAQATYFYVLDEDDSSHVFVLFPLAGRGARNPLVAGARAHLPGREAGPGPPRQGTPLRGARTRPPAPGRGAPGPRRRPPPPPAPPPAGAAADGPPGP